MLGANDKTRRTQSNSLRAGCDLDGRPTASSTCCRSRPSSATPPAPSCNTTSAPWRSGAARPSPARRTRISPPARVFSTSTASRSTRSGFAEVMPRDRRPSRPRARRRARRRLARHRVAQHRPAAQCQRRDHRRHQLLPRHHRAQAHGWPRSSIRASVAREQEQRLAATYEHAAIGISEIAPDGTFPARQRGDLRHHRLYAARTCWPAGCFATRIPTMPSPTARASASRSPATWTSIRSRSASCARTAA